MQSRRINAQHPEFFAGFVGSPAAMTPPSASGGFVEALPLIERLLKPPEAAITETTPSAPSLESAAPGCCIERGDPNHRQRHAKKVLVQRSSGYIAIMSFVGRSCLTTAQRFAQAKGLRHANECFVEGRVAVRVEVAHDIADNRGNLWLVIDGGGTDESLMGGRMSLDAWTSAALSRCWVL